MDDRPSEDRVAGETGRRALGRFGEAIAEGFLRRQGYEIVERNWRCRQGEIDLVARQGGDWVFVEVRTRRGQGCGTAEESVTPAKQRRLLQLAALFLQERDLPDVSWRIDVVAIELDRAGRPARVELLPAAVSAEGGWV
jgi:putative endonuclease